MDVGIEGDSTDSAPIRISVGEIGSAADLGGSAVLLERALDMRIVTETPHNQRPQGISETPGTSGNDGTSGRRRDRTEGI
jgi:hypothetical protein